MASGGIKVFPRFVMAYYSETGIIDFLLLAIINNQPQEIKKSQEVGPGSFRGWFVKSPLAVSRSNPAITR